MSAVYSPITTGSDSWKDHIISVCNNHSKAMQVAHQRHTRDVIEQTKEDKKRCQKVQDFLVDNS